LSQSQDDVEGLLSTQDELLDSFFESNSKRTWNDAFQFDSPVKRYIFV